MAFTFQTHPDLKFKQDHYLLNKAEQYKPEFIYHTYCPTGICELVQDESKLEGWTTKLTNRVLEKESYQKEDTFILDFGQHHVGYFPLLWILLGHLWILRYIYVFVLQKFQQNSLTKVKNMMAG